MTERVLLDSAVLIYAFGGQHHYRAPCRRLLQAVRTGELRGEVTALTLQEVMHQRARRTGDRAHTAEAIRDLATALTVHDLRVDDVEQATELFAASDALDAADACHAATSINRDIATIVSPDAAFDAVVGLTRVDPVDAAAQL